MLSGPKREDRYYAENIEPDISLILVFLVGSLQL
jgi:hypothetical protein